MRAWAVAGILLASLRVWAWGDLGHETVAEIAERHLSEKARKVILALMGPEPMAVMAIWPDKVRSDARFKPFDVYHFVDFHNPAPKSLDVLLRQFPRLLTQSSTSEAQKRLLLKYFIHGVGDAHMPLHVNGGADQGGNLCEVRWKHPVTGREETVNLHVLWDTNLVELFRDEAVHHTRSLKKYSFNYTHLADLLGAFHGPKTQAMEATLKGDFHVPFETWYSEAQALHAKVYPDSKPVKTPQDREYCRASETAPRVAAEKVPLVSAAYVKASQELVGQRIYLAGRRLAVLIEEKITAEIPVPESVDSAALQTRHILEAIQPTR